MPKKKRGSRSKGSQQFTVEVIKAAKVEDGEWLYKVKWAGYDSSEDTWEPIENFREGCQRLLKSFWSNVGMDNEDYREGYTVYATPTWIKKEKKRFAQSLSGDQPSSAGESEGEPAASRNKEEPVIHKDERKNPTTGKKRGRPPKPKPKQDSRVDHAADSDDAPLSNLPRKGKKRARLAESSEDDDDEPLAKHRKPKPAPASSAQSAAPGPSAGAGKEPQHDSDSESAGSLFSERASSPEVALGATAPTGAPTTEAPGTTVPMKRPSVDEGATDRHRKRQVMEMPMVITGTAGNSTKARLAQRGQQPPAPPPGPGERPVTKKLDLSSLSFKKKSATTNVPSPVQAEHSPTTPALPRGITSRPTNLQASPPADVPALTEQPRPTPPLPRLNEARRAPPPLSRGITTQSQAKDTVSEADKFLSNIMPPEMAAPMNEDLTPDTPTTPGVPPLLSKAKAPLSLPRIGKKWRWSGEVFMDVSPDKAERVCEITLHDPTEALPNGLRFSICLKGDSIRLSPFHDMSSLPLFLDACARVQQFARVGPKEDNDADAVKQLSIYMMKKSYFCYAHLYVEETSVGLLVIFPAGHPLATKYLKPPVGQAGDATLQAALVPWELKAKDFHKLQVMARSSMRGPALDPAFLPVLDNAGRKVVTQRRFYQALHILGFPKALYDFLNVPNHPYCIWYAPEDVTASGPGYETSLLKEILSTCVSKDVGYKVAARVIFVHVGALATLHRFPGLADIRGEHADNRFVTYGTHPGIPRERWGIRELYPLGGIATFTPSAIIQGHYHAFKLINQIAEHPLWDCYVLPSVVAMVAKLSCQGQHPLQAYDEGKFIYEDLLQAIEDGSLALLQAPQPSHEPAAQDSAVLWTRWMFRIAGHSARDILEECLKLAAEQFANTSDADLPDAIQQEVARDLLRMQLQPAIMDNYRRFIVLRTKQDSYFAESSKNGIECTSHDKFDFKDDYFAASNEPEKK